jgi:hypothetical protein
MRFFTRHTRTPHKGPAVMPANSAGKSEKSNFIYGGMNGTGISSTGIMSMTAIADMIAVKTSLYKNFLFLLFINKIKPPTKIGGFKNLSLHYVQLFSLIRTVPSAQESHLLGSLRC